MQKKLISLLCLFFVLFLISACSTNENKKTGPLPGIEIPIEKINREFSLVDDPAFGNKYQNGFSLDFGVENKSDFEIIFPWNFGVKVFTQRNGPWEEVENRMGYPDKNISLPTKKIFPPGGVLSIIPFISDLNSATTIRIVAEGFIKDQPNEKVGAFIDVILNP
jgi:hypothetical protein